MRRVVPLILGTVGVGFVVILVAAQKMLKASGAVIAYEPPSAAPASSGYLPAVAIPKQLTPAIIDSARGWANARGVPLQEILATILVESSGNPRAWANTSIEDSRGLMQVNTRVWANLLSQNGMTADDLWDIDKNIQIGSYIYATYRKNVANWIAQSGCPQKTPIDVLTRLSYRGPAFVQKKILACADASNPYNSAPQTITAWQSALNKVAGIA